MCISVCARVFVCVCVYFCVCVFVCVYFCVCVVCVRVCVRARCYACVRPREGVAYLLHSIQHNAKTGSDQQADKCQTGNNWYQNEQLA